MVISDLKTYFSVAEKVILTKNDQETRIRGNTMNMRGGNAQANNVNINDKNKKPASGGGCC